MATPADPRRAPSPGLARRLEEAWLTRGPLAWALLPLAGVFAALTALRRTLYRIGWLRSERLPVPVLVVGNLIAGGAGKTPTVIAIVEVLRRRGFRPGIVSRGHGRRGDAIVEVRADMAADKSGDEPLLLHLRLRVPVVVGRDRAAAARELLRLHPEVDLIVSDDGLQHLRLVRDLQVLVFDSRGIGNGWLLPAGPLRQTMPPEPPPRSIVLYNATPPSTGWPGHAAQARLRGAVGLAGWWSGEAATPAALEALAGRPLLAAAGMAQPERFFALLEGAGINIRRCPLPDHHDYATLPWPADAPDVIVTEKDAVKLKPQRMASTRIWVAPLDLAPGAAFDAALLDLLPNPGSNHDGHPTA